MTGKRRRQRVEGDLVRIDLGDGSHAYGWTLPSPLYAFFSGTFVRDLEPAAIVALPIAFTISVHMDAAWWPAVGRIPLPEALKEEPYFFMQDIIDGSLSPYHSSFPNWRRPAALDECRGLERAAVRDPEHVVDRLRDLRDGRENIWARSMEIDVSKIRH